MAKKQVCDVGQNKLKQASQTAHKRFVDAEYTVLRSKPSQSLFMVACLCISLVFVAFCINRYVADISVAKATSQLRPNTQQLLINKSLTLATTQVHSVSTQEHIETLQTLRMHNVLRQNQAPAIHDIKHVKINKSELASGINAETSTSIKQLIAKWESELSASSDN